MKTNQIMVRPMGEFNGAQRIKEKWIDIDGYNGLYKISNYGRLISYRKNTPRILKCNITKKRVFKSNVPYKT